MIPSYFKLFNRLWKILLLEKIFIVSSKFAFAKLTKLRLRAYARIPFL